MFRLILFVVSSFLIVLGNSEGFDLRLTSLKDVSKYLERQPIDYTPPPPSEICTVYKKEEDQFTFYNGTMSQWIRKCELGKVKCEFQKYRAGEFITIDKHMLYGWYAWEMKVPSVNTSGLWVEFGLSNVGALKAIVIGIVGQHPKKAYTSTTVNIIHNAENPDLPRDSRDGFHEYGFLWNEKYITWTFDGKVLRNETNESKIPKEKHAMGSYFDFYPNCGGYYEKWLGHFDESILPVAAEVRRWKYVPGATTIISP